MIQRINVLTRVTGTECETDQQRSVKQINKDQWLLKIIWANKVTQRLGHVDLVFGPLPPRSIRHCAGI